MNNDENTIISYLNDLSHQLDSQDDCNSSVNNDKYILILALKLIIDKLNGGI